MNSNMIVSVKDWFDSQNMTQVKAAAMVGISRGYLCDMMANKGGEYYTDGTHFYIKKAFKKTNKNTLHVRKGAA